jgi:DNA (cytosine-5)-methyltransferase 1
MARFSFGSVCSGIEAASVAWKPLGWRAAWFSEIEPFPCAALAHHYPETPNLGDMTRIARRVLTGEVNAPDVLCGGTPCQAFSVAGLRKSLDDDRGNLTLKFVELADAIDHVRVARGDDAAIIVWENVPGVLSTKDNAFGCFLAGLAGEDGELQPPGRRWEDAGAVYGPRRSVAWRTLDAQYFGLAQRRRRVFVVASARDDFDPAQVLFEWDGVRRDTAPRREAGEGAAPCVTAGAANGGAAHGARSGSAKDNLIVPCLDASFGRLQGCSGQDANHGHGHLIPQAFGGNNQAGPIEVATARNACASASGRMDFESETFLVQPAHTLRGEGFDASEDGTGRGTPLVPVGVDGYNGALTGGVAATMGTRGSSETATGSQVMVPAAHAFDARQSDVIQYGDKTGPLDTDGHSVGVLAEHYTHDYCHDRVYSVGGLSPALNTAQRHNIRAASQVRRLTPRECERLQGFPDDYTLIPWRTWQEATRKGASYEGLLRQRGMTLRGQSREECPDGPRYKALGNSWAVPVVQWIGERIAAHLARPEPGTPRPAASCGCSGAGVAAVARGGVV